jgi:hypothetical protein
MSARAGESAPAYRLFREGDCAAEEILGAEAELESADLAGLELGAGRVLRRRAAPRRLLRTAAATCCGAAVGFAAITGLRALTPEPGAGSAATGAPSVRRTWLAPRRSSSAGVAERSLRALASPRRDAREAAIGAGIAGRASAEAPRPPARAQIVTGWSPPPAPERADAGAREFGFEP